MDWNPTIFAGFEQYANTIHISIQIELCYCQEKTEFLETWMKLENGLVYTDLYKEPSDRQLYIKKIVSPFPSYEKPSLLVSIANQTDL